jgi:hypothetical protein
MVGSLALHNTGMTAMTGRTDTVGSMSSHGSISGLEKTEAP